MSNGKRMDFEKVVRTVLKKYPNGIRSKELVKILERQTGLGRSSIYSHLGDMNNVGNIYREKGIYWLEKPSKGQDEPVKELVRLAGKLVTNAPPFISREVDLAIGKRKIRIRNE